MFSSRASRSVLQCGRTVLPRKNVSSATQGFTPRAAFRCSSSMPMVDIATARLTPEELTQRTLEKKSASIPEVPVRETVVYHPDGLSKQNPDASRFAVVPLAGSQYKVTKGDRLFVNKLAVEVGDIVELKEVLLVGCQTHTVVGRPLVNNATVHVLVEQQLKEKKIVVFKMRRRKGYRKKKGSRRLMTVLKVLDIQYPDVNDKALEGVAEISQVNDTIGYYRRDGADDFEEDDDSDDEFDYELSDSDAEDAEWDDEGDSRR